MRTPEYPYAVTWLMTDRCNRQCPHCYFETKTLDDRSSQDLPTRRCLEIIDELAACKVFMINFGGYEPLVRDDFLAIAREAHKRKMTLQMSTNGTLLSEPIVLELKESGFRRIQVSLDGSRPEINDPIRGDGSFKAAIRGIKLLKEKNLLVHLAISVVDENFHDIIPLIRLARDLGCSVLKLQPFTPFGRGLKNSRRFELEAGRLENLLMDIHALEKRGSFRPLEINYPAFVYPLLEKNIESDKDKPFAVSVNHCGAGITTCVITPEGFVIPCFFQPDEIWGDLTKESFKTIWLMSKERRRPTDLDSCSCKDR